MEYWHLTSNINVRDSAHYIIERIQRSSLWDMFRVMIEVVKNSAYTVK